jgi:hypothetical protein
MWLRDPANSERLRHAVVIASVAFALLALVLIVIRKLGAA